MLLTTIVKLTTGPTTELKQSIVISHSIRLHSYILYVAYITLMLALINII